MHTATDHASEVNAEKRECGIWHRINESFNEMVGGGNEFVVLATEGNDLRLWIDVGHESYAVTVQSGAVDQEAGLECALIGFQQDFLFAMEDLLDASTHVDDAALL